MILEEKIKFENTLLPNIKKFNLDYNGDHIVPDKGTMFLFTSGNQLNQIRVKILVSEVKMIEVYIEAVDQPNHLFVLNYNFTFTTLDRLEYTIKKFAELVNLKF